MGHFSFLPFSLQWHQELFPKSIEISVSRTHRVSAPLFPPCQLSPGPLYVLCPSLSIPLTQSPPMEFTDPSRPSLVNIPGQYSLVNIPLMLVRNLPSIPTKDSPVPTSPPSGRDDSVQPGEEQRGAFLPSKLPWIPAGVCPPVFAREVARVPGGRVSLSWGVQGSRLRGWWGVVVAVSAQDLYKVFPQNSLGWNRSPRSNPTVVGTGT